MGKGQFFFRKPLLQVGVESPKLSLQVDVVSCLMRKVSSISTIWLTPPKKKYHQSNPPKKKTKNNETDSNLLKGISRFLFFIKNCRNSLRSNLHQLPKPCNGCINPNQSADLGGLVLSHRWSANGRGLSKGHGGFGWSFCLELPSLKWAKAPHAVGWVIVL